MTPTGGLLTIAETCGYLACSRTKLDQLVKQKVFQKISTEWGPRFAKNEIEAHLARLRKSA